MFKIKSISKYFYSFFNSLINNLKYSYFKTNYYNKKISRKIPTRYIYKPSPHIINSLITLKKKKIKIENLSLNSIWDVNSKNFSERGFAERQAINAPIQGSAADIIKRAMIRLNQKLIFGKFSSRMLLQVHDELVFECPEDEIINLKEIIIHEMENAHKPVCELSVPLIVDCGVGLSWSESH